LDRKPNSTRLIGDGAGDGLAYPPGGIGGKSEALMHVILLDRLHQAEIALLDQIEESDTSAHITLGNAYHKARIGFNDLFASQDAILHEGFEALPFRAVLASGTTGQIQPGFPS